nr:MAG TPA: hypothetical protein [Caudoviricetes sp.]
MFVNAILQNIFIPPDGYAFVTAEPFKAFLCLHSGTVLLRAENVLTELCEIQTFSESIPIVFITHGRKCGGVALANAQIPNIIKKKESDMPRNGMISMRLRVGRLKTDTKKGLKLIG